MEFCDRCENLCFLKQNNDQDNIKALQYLCKSCGETKPKLDNDNCLYSTTNNNDNDYKILNLSNNPYINKDLTLPRLNNVKCINKECLTNIPNCFILKNVDLKLETNRYLIDFINQITNKYTIDISPIDLNKVATYGDIHTLGNSIITNIPHEERIKTNPIYLVTFKDITESDFHLIYLKLLENSYSESNLLAKKLIVSLTQDIKPELSIIQKEIISIKYNSLDMKYMYICSTCGSSWKNLN